MSKRGMALGVAVINRSSFCARPSRDRLPGHWDETCRVMVSIVHTSLGPTKLISFYGVQHNAEDSYHKNVTLWHAILSLAGQLDMPTLIGGDANLRVQDLEVWQCFSDMGFSETFEMYRNKFGEDLPPTCNGATRHDTLIFSRHFSPLFLNACVVHKGLFPCHDPLIVDFAMKQPEYLLRTLPSPEPLVDDILNMELFQQMQSRFLVKARIPSVDQTKPCSADFHDSFSSSLRVVSDTFERAYDCTVARHNLHLRGSQPCPFRRNRRVKRCHVQGLEQKPCRQSPRPARCGDYEPPTETFWVRNVQCVKQLRRLQALRMRMKKYEVDSMPPSVSVQNAKEWYAIQSVQSFKPSFARWCFNQKLCNDWYHECPPFRWLDTLCSMMKTCVDFNVREEAKIRSKSFRHAIDLDNLHFGGSLSHAIVRGKTVPSPSTFMLQKQAAAKLVRMPGKHRPCFNVTSDDQLGGMIDTKVDGQSVQLMASPDDSYVMDPFFYAVLRTLLNWKRLMMTDRASHDTIKYVLLQASDDPVHAFGPASVLCCYLKIIGWSLLADGSVCDHMDRSFCLRSIPSPSLVHFLWDAWDCLPTNKIHERKSLQLWPEVDALQTRRVELPTDNRERAILANLRCIGTLWGDQREKWTDASNPDDLGCPLCSGPDSREHFPFECPGVSDLRETYHDTIQDAKEHFPHLCFIPVIHKHPQCKLLQMANFERVLPPPFDVTHSSSNREHAPVFYTDGSCIFPEQGGRLSTWAIIHDGCNSDEERIAQVNLYKATGVVPSSFATVQVGMTTGPQTINRAEFSAMIQIVASTSCAIIVSDSQWAIDNFEKIKLEPDFTMHMGAANEDLLFKLCELAHEKCLSNFVLKKIAAHQTDDMAVSDLHLYDILGNREADKAAKLGCQRSISPIHDAAWTVGEWYKHQIKVLDDIQPFLAKAEARRLDAFDQVLHSAKNEEGKLFSIPRALKWEPDAKPMCEPFAIPEEVLASFLPGASVLQLIVDFLLSLRWPDEPTPGVTCSWFELTANFIGVTGLQPPRIANRGAVNLDFKDPVYDDSALLLPLKVWDVVRLLETAASHIHKLMGLQLVPFHLTKTRWHLGFVGYHNKVAGFLLRPVLHKLDKHCESLRQLVTANGLSVPQPLDGECLFTRHLLDLDHIPYLQRCTNLRKVRAKVKKSGFLDAAN
eukprot:Skav225868  [mRNA]  locus=scaffold810:341328:346295:+ [translate_table: standard]